MRTHIPTNHNPFYYFDKSIISVDTLKQNNEFRTYLEQARWDIIVIDEAHNVAERGSKRSMRAKLAKLLATRSDTLVLLSATPHDGKAESFASLIHMLDPTAIANPAKYGPDKIRGLYIRRFKQDVSDQLIKAFKDPHRSSVEVNASPQEEVALGMLKDMQFTKVDKARSGQQLFRTTLEKGLLSSPAACLKTTTQRIARLRRHDKADEYSDDIATLEEFSKALEAIHAQHFSKLQRLAALLKSKEFKWTGKVTGDRLVIFSERIETLHFLREHLPGLLGLKAPAFELLHGGMADRDQQQVVEAFGQEKTKIRVLLASDVAAEGINLHFLCHRLVHFDIPWSLMTFQQRNGRIDRYGQEHPPQLIYLLTRSTHEGIQADTHILEMGAITAFIDQVRHENTSERICVVAGKVPLTLFEDSGDATVLRAHEVRERALLYVAMTRARTAVLITCHDEPSPLLQWG